MFPNIFREHLLASHSIWGVKEETQNQKNTSYPSSQEQNFIPNTH